VGTKSAESLRLAGPKKVWAPELPEPDDRVTHRTSAFVDGEGHPLAFATCEIKVGAGPDRGLVFTSAKSLIRVGAAEDNDVVLTDGAVSRYHLEVEMKGGDYHVVDLGSTNGTFVGSLQISRATLRGPTDLRIGNDVVHFLPHVHRETVAPSLSRRCGDLVGGSAPMREVFGVIERVGPTDLPIMICGETGTGKELAARALHDLSRRAEKPFVTLDCSSLPPTLIESALFGYERGAFTGADRSYAGVFERAHGGTLFLDELGELPLDLQPKLLRAVERGEIERLRGEGAIRVDVRLVSATNRAMESMVEAGRFRSDLYYRLAVVNLTLPPLRERKEDLPLLVSSFLERFKEELKTHGKNVTRFDDGALAVLAAHSFPGNVRELANLVRRTALLAPDEIIRASDLPRELVAPRPARPATPIIKVAPPPPLPTAEEAQAAWEGLTFKDAKTKLVDDFEREYLEDVLERHRFNVSGAAREAGIGRRHFHRLLEKYGIDPRRGE
jgi:DNA-binding NtrC family response regulator